LIRRWRIANSGILLIMFFFPWIKFSYESAYTGWDMIAYEISNAISGRINFPFELGILCTFIYILANIKIFIFVPMPVARYWILILPAVGVFGMIFTLVWFVDDAGIRSGLWLMILALFFSIILEIIHLLQHSSENERLDVDKTHH
jgi:hypothetical protein